MAYTTRKIFYFSTTVEDKPGEAYKLLTALADIGINLLAFNAVPIGPMHTQLSLFPDDENQMVDQARKTGLKLDGPYPALLIQGDDELGALAEVHEKLYQASVNIYASTGVTDSHGNYGYLVYVRPEDHNRAAKALKL
jgi:hypothetical protein